MEATRHAHTYAAWVDAKDQVWLTDWSINAIVTFDPVTEKFEAFPSNRSQATYGKCSAVPARHGARSRATTDW